MSQFIVTPWLCDELRRALGASVLHFAPVAPEPASSAGTAAGIPVSAAEVGPQAPVVRGFDEIRIDGIHPRNPITDEEITTFLQAFVVTRDQFGGVIDPRDLSPRCCETEPIPMSRIRAINGRAVRPLASQPHLSDTERHS